MIGVFELIFFNFYDLFLLIIFFNKKFRLYKRINKKLFKRVLGGGGFIYLLGLFKRFFCVLSYKLFMEKKN